MGSVAPSQQRIADAVRPVTPVGGMPRQYQAPVLSLLYPNMQKTADPNTAVMPGTLHSNPTMAKKIMAAAPPTTGDYNTAVMPGTLHSNPTVANQIMALSQSRSAVTKSLLGQ